MILQDEPLLSKSPTTKREWIFKTSEHCDHYLHYFTKLNWKFCVIKDSIRSFCQCPFIQPPLTIAAMKFYINSYVICTQLTNVFHRPKYLPCSFFPLYAKASINGTYIMDFTYFLKTLALLLNKSCNTCSKAMAQSYDEKNISLIYFF